MPAWEPVWSYPLDFVLPAGPHGGRRFSERRAPRRTRKFFTDGHLIARMTKLEINLHPPTAREIVMVRAKAWEGSGSDFETVMRAGDAIRMYYVGAKLIPL